MSNVSPSVVAETIAIVGIAVVVVVAVVVAVILKRKATYAAPVIMLVGTMAMLVTGGLIGGDVGPLIVPFLLLNVGFLGFTSMCVRLDRKREAASADRSSSSGSSASDGGTTGDGT